MTKPSRKRRKPQPAPVRRADKGLKQPPERTDNSGSAMLGAGGLAEIRQFIRLVQRTGIGELEVSSGDRTVRIAAQASVPASAGPPSAVAAPAADGGRAGKAQAEAPGPENAIAITSPMVGTFYRAPAPDADPYLEVGDIVEVGQTVCIIEAMKLMNEIESEHRGRVVKILIENAQPVEFGQKLFLIEPA
jgi:acetyl-CoA carboxylase biotin carboxyl carrier protein